MMRETNNIQSEITDYHRKKYKILIYFLINFQKDVLF